MCGILSHLDLRIKQMFSLLGVSMIKLLFQDPRSLALQTPGQEQAPHLLLGDQLLQQDQRQRMKDLVSMVLNIPRDQGSHLEQDIGITGVNGAGLIFQRGQLTLLVNNSLVPSLPSVFSSNPSRLLLDL